MASVLPETAIPILPANNLPRLMAFYKRLGFKLHGPGAAPDPYVIARLGTFEIHLWKTRKARIGIAYLRTTSVKKLHARFGRIGLPRTGAPSLSGLCEMPWGMREFTLVDPERNLLRIGEFI